MATRKKFQGTGTALVTPFTRDGKLDEQTVRRLVEFQIKGGVEAIIPAGTTGESPTLEEDEHRRLIEIVVDQNRKRVKIIAGAGTNSTAHSIRLSKQAKEAGADILLLVGPYYNKPSQEGYYQHFRTIAEAVDLPFIVYNVPTRTSGNIEPSTLLRIAKDIPTAAGVKEASGSMPQIMEIARNKPEGFSLLSGDDVFTLPLMAVGGDGVISVISNEVPKIFSEMVRYCLKNNYKKAVAIHNKLLPLMQANFFEANPMPVKAALAMMGMIEEVYRLPLVKIGDANRQKLLAVLRELKLLKG
ncbi:MAG: 4-hydroxy-tetrahydrodipicolinate synthase [Bacteroidota bacterium]